MHAYAVVLRSQYYNNTETRGFSVKFERWLGNYEANSYWNTPLFILNNCKTYQVQTIRPQLSFLTRSFILEIDTILFLERGETFKNHTQFWWKTPL